MFNISIYAHGDIKVASTRLRGHYLFLSSQNYGYRTFYNESFLTSLSKDILYLQMVYKPKNIIQAIIYRLLRKRVIFDIDDAAVFLKHKIAMLFLANIASHVTVDTHARKGFWGKRILFNLPIVIRDTIDLDPIKNNEFVKRKLSSDGGILWIGNRENLHSIEPLLESQEAFGGRTIYIASNFLKNDPVKTLYKNIHFIDWELDISYKTEIINASFMVLNHIADVDTYSKYKSENKMVTAIASGLIPIVSASPAYSELAGRLEASRIVFNSLDEVPGILDSLEDDWMNSFSFRAKDYIADHYSHENIFNNLRTLVLENKN